MFNFVDELVKNYEPKQKSISEVMTRLGVTTGHDQSTDQYGDQQSLNSIYDNITWVYRCIGFIASNLARIPWIYKRGDEEVELSYNVFQDPNPMQTRYDFMVESISSLKSAWTILRSCGRILYRAQINKTAPDSEKRVKDSSVGVRTCSSFLRNTGTTPQNTMVTAKPP